MGPQGQSDETSGPDRTQALRATRLALGFYLDIFEITRAGGRMVDTVVFAGISVASVARLSGSPSLEVAFATEALPPPDALRRPATINGVARSLRLPAETVRRRAAALVEAGLIERTPEGVVQTAGGAAQPAYLALAHARYERLRRLWLDLGGPGAGAAPGTPLDGPPLRIANRALAEFGLRFRDRFASLAGDPLGELVTLEVARASGEGLDEALAFGKPPPPGARAVPMAEVARRLQLPFETVRRKSQALVEAGVLGRERQGLIPGAAALQPDARPGLGETAADLARLMRRLETLGVAGWWAAEQAGGQLAQPTRAAAAG